MAQVFYASKDTFTFPNGAVYAARNTEQGDEAIRYHPALPRYSKAG